MKRKIIAVSGVKGSGKDESADMLIYCLSAPKFLQHYWCYKLGFGSFCGGSKTSFAQPLKEMLAALLNVPVKKFDERYFKEKKYVNFKNFKIVDMPSPEYRYNDNQFNKAIKSGTIFTENKMLSIRQLMQYFGTEIMQTVFGKHIGIVSTLNNICGNTVISDLRFKEEAKYVKEYGGKVIYIQRPNTEFGAHASEQEMQTMLQNGEYDHIIENNGTLQDLFNNIKEYANTKCVSYR